MLTLDVAAILLIRETETHIEALNVHFIVSVVISGCFSPQMYIHLMRMMDGSKQNGVAGRSQDQTLSTFYAVPRPTSSSAVTNPAIHIESV